MRMSHVSWTPNHGKIHRLHQKMTSTELSWPLTGERVGAEIDLFKLLRSMVRDVKPKQSIRSLSFLHLTVTEPRPMHGEWPQICALWPQQVDSGELIPSNLLDLRSTQRLIWLREENGRGTITDFAAMLTTEEPTAKRIYAQCAEQTLSAACPAATKTRTAATTPCRTMRNPKNI